MVWYEDEVRGLEARLRAVTPGRVVFYGSSSIRLWETLEADFPHTPVVNAGFGGSTLEACGHFFDRLVPPCEPAALVVYAGDNDLGDGRSSAQVLAYFRTLQFQIESRLPGVPWAFVSIKPSPARLPLMERICLANEHIRREITEIPGARYVDVFHPMLDDEGLPRPILFAEDGLHLSREGYRLWRQVLTERLSGILNPPALPR